METKRSSFTGKIGFVLAAAGSAVGLGNIWRFPNLVAKNGGGIFLLTYIILSVTFGFALMVAEIAIGRKTGLSAVGAYQKLNKKFSFIGYLGALIPILILPYYSVIGGWVTKYLFAFSTGDAANAAGESYFSNFISKTGEPIFWFAVFLGVTAIVVLLGVEKGIEKVSKIMMPVLIVLSIGIVIYTMFIPGAIDGVCEYIVPDFSEFSINTVVDAMGQLFYSMSLAMGIMITYGSYMKKDVSIEASTHQIEIFDTGVAFLSGLMIIPAVHLFKPELLDAEFLAANPDIAEKSVGSGLMFETLPSIFKYMPGGAVIGAVFFLLVLFAALTSSISLMETVVSIFQDKFKWSRKRSCLIVLLVCVLLGIPSSLGYGAWSSIKLLGMSFLSFFDFITNSVFMPIVALFTCIFIGYIIKPQAIEEEVELSDKFKFKKLFNIMIKYIAPVFLVIILVSSIISAF